MTLSALTATIPEELPDGGGLESDGAIRLKLVGGIALVAALALSGCGGSDMAEGDEGAVTISTSSSSSPSSASSSPTPETITTADGTFALGEAVTLSDVTFTVSEVKKGSSPHSQLPSDQQWWQVMVQACSAADDVAFSWGPWSIQGGDGGTYPASDSTWSDFPKPQYPFSPDRLTPKGKCVKGWMMIALDANTKPATIDYGNTIGETVSWVAE